MMAICIVRPRESLIEIPRSKGNLTTAANKKMQEVRLRAKKVFRRILNDFIMFLKFRDANII